MSEEVVDPEKRADQMEKEMIELREAYIRDFGDRRRSSPKGEQPWKSKCCGPDGTEISKSFLVFGITSVLSIIILIFALYELAQNDPSDPLNPLWISLVSSVSAIHVPSPLQQTDSKK